MAKIYPPPHDNPTRLASGRVETAREARQGPLGRPVLLVLIGGLFFAGLFLLIILSWSGSEDLPPANQIQDTPVVVTP